MYLEKLTNLIKQHEGLRLTPYRCTAGKLTIGYGRNLDDRGITLGEAKNMLSADIVDTLDTVTKRFDWFCKLNEDRKIVIIDMVFNLGFHRFLKFKKMIKALEVQDYTEASIQMLDSKWSKQVGERAQTLANAMKAGLLV